MRVLVACEESQRVCSEFRKRGHEAYSCDIIDCSGGHPEWHIKEDVLNILNPWYGEHFEDDLRTYQHTYTYSGIDFQTCDGHNHCFEGRWDMIIAFPPCTDLAVSGARHFEKKRNDGRQRKSIEFFCKILTADCDKIAIENPVNIISGIYIYIWFPDICKKYGLPLKPTQHIQPYEFGEHARKKTCLWLKNLKPLVPENVVDYGEVDNEGQSYGASLAYARDENGKILAWNDPRTAKIRSKTYVGVAKAMGNQWG